MIEMINSLDDSRLEVYARLTEVQLRNKLEPEKGIFIAESDKVIDRALDAGYEPLSLLIPDHKLESMSKLLERAQAASKKSQDLPVFVAPAKEIEKLAGYELTRGVLCAMRRKPLLSVRELLEKTNARRVAILEDITNHTNVGAWCRCCFGNASVLRSALSSCGTRVYGDGIPGALDANWYDRN